MVCSCCLGIIVLFLVVCFLVLFWEVGVGFGCCVWVLVVGCGED